MHRSSFPRRQFGGHRMSFRRTTQFRRFPARRGRFKNGRMRHMMISRLVSGMVKSNQEKKFFDTVVSTTVDSVGEVFHLTPLPQGNGSSNREGAAVKLINVNYKGGIISADATNSVRIIIFKDKDSIGNIPTVANVIAPTNITGFLDNTNRVRFQILSDKVFTVSNNGPIAVVFKVFYKFQNNFTRQNAMDTKFANQAMFSGTSTAPRSNAVFMLVISDSTAPANPAIEMVLRVRYTDA